MVTDSGNGQATDDLISILAAGEGGLPIPMPPEFANGFLGPVNHFATNTVAGGVCSPNFPPVL